MERDDRFVQIALSPAELEKLREEQRRLVEAVDKKGSLLDQEVLNISRRLDALIIRCYRHRQ